MKRTEIFESFKEAAERFRDGGKIHHQTDGHEEKECAGWQKGVMAFAEFLDALSVEVAVKLDDGDIERIYYPPKETA